MLSSEFLSYKRDSENGGCHVGRVTGCVKGVRSLSYVLLSKWNIERVLVFGVATLMNLQQQCKLIWIAFSSRCSRSKGKWSDENTCHLIKRKHIVRWNINSHIFWMTIFHLEHWTFSWIHFRASWIEAGSKDGDFNSWKWQVTYLLDDAPGI